MKKKQGNTNYCLRKSTHFCKCIRATWLILDIYTLWKKIVFPPRCKLIKFKHLLYFTLLVIFIYLLHITLFVKIISNKRITTPTPLLAALYKPVIEKNKNNLTKINQGMVLTIPSEKEFRMKWIQNKLDKITKHSKKWDIVELLRSSTPLTRPSQKVHVFYYTRYRNLKSDGEWKLWNEVNVHGRTDLTSKRTIISPPEEITSSYYPMLGCYSSRDINIINVHFKQIRDAGIGVVILSWSQEDTETEPNNGFMNNILEQANIHELKVTFSIESYPGRNYSSLLNDIHAIVKKYNSHPATYKVQKNGRHLPVYYIHESHLIPPSDWKKILAPGERQSVRGTSHDGIFMGLLIDQRHRYEIEKSSFDGFYTFFSSNGFSYGSSWKNWKALQQFAMKSKLLFFPSISPGYVDTKIRPWNTLLTRHRSRGQYYQLAWRSVISAQSYGVSINSFNKWHEGSQIEPAQPKTTPKFRYLDYEPEGPFFYLNLTRYWVKKFESESNSHEPFR